MAAFSVGIIENWINKNYHDSGQTFYKNAIAAQHFVGSETRTEEEIDDLIHKYVTNTYMGNPGFEKPTE